MAAVAAGRAGSFGSSSSGLGSSAATATTNNNNAELRAGGDEDDGQNLWSCILSEVSTRSRSKLPSGKSVLLLGEDGAGKTSLIGKIQGIEEYKKGRGMEYLYLNVHDEDRDDQTRCNVWILDGDLYHKGLLKFAIECDAISILEKEHDYRDEHFDFIQSHIRRFCLQYGAALIYTSVKENKNIDLVYKYIVQKLYGFPFNVPAVVVEKDAVFIPAGWDNDKKIGILHENFQTLKAEDSFEDIITKPPVRKFVHEKEIVAEDDQVFLMKQQSQLAKQPPTAAGRPVDASPRVPGGSPRTPNRSVTSNVASVTPIPTGSKKIDPNMKAGATSEGVLANFFNSLLSKKTGSPGGPGGVGGSPGGGGTGGAGSNLPPSAKKSGQKPVLTDVQAELDRISRKPEMVSPTTPTSPTEGEAS
ncbi:cytoplasmic dynein 1 light intermediate chain 1 isoform X2 [Strix aluco]|uniref:cytoplasmic dynein 1 light intermediate chain 1 isoform X2 n=1 Tax=Strix aluco TaxID=111821 RepID=UPI003DA523F1